MHCYIAQSDIWEAMLTLAYVADEVSSSPWGGSLFFAQAAAGRLALRLVSERIHIRR